MELEVCFVFLNYENKLMFFMQLYLVVVLPASLLLGLGESPSFWVCSSSSWLANYDFANSRTLVRVRLFFPLGRLPVDRKCGHDNFRRQHVYCRCLLGGRKVISKYYLLLMFAEVFQGQQHSVRLLDGEHWVGYLYTC